MRAYLRFASTTKSGKEKENGDEKHAKQKVMVARSMGTQKSRKIYLRFDSTTKRRKEENGRHMKGKAKGMKRDMGAVFIRSAACALDGAEESRTEFGFDLIQ